MFNVVIFMVSSYQVKTKMFLTDGKMQGYWIDGWTMCKQYTPLKLCFVGGYKDMVETKL